MENHFRDVSGTWVWARSASFYFHTGHLIINISVSVIALPGLHGQHRCAQYNAASLFNIKSCIIITVLAHFAFGCWAVRHLYRQRRSRVCVCVCWCALVWCVCKDKIELHIVYNRWWWRSMLSLIRVLISRLLAVWGFQFNCRSPSHY